MGGREVLTTEVDVNTHQTVSPDVGVTPRFNDKPHSRQGRFWLCKRLLKWFLWALWEFSGASQFPIWDRPRELGNGSLPEVEDPGPPGVTPQALTSSLHL